MTVLKYLQNPEFHTTAARVTSVNTDGSSIVVQLDVTPFYPKGGGQPSDQGTIIGPNGNMIVTKVVHVANGDVHHIGEIRSGSFKENEVIEAKIDQQNRIKNSRLHTTGEVICAAIHDMGKAWPVTAASHFPGQARVAFASDLEAESLQSFIHQFKDRFHHIVSSDFPIKAMKDVSLAEAQELCPMDANQLTEKVGSLRLISPIPGFFRPCLGAHLKTTGEIGCVSFRKIRLRKGQLSISYDMV